MFIVALLSFILALGAGIVLLIIIKTPKLTPKKTIVETIMGANDIVFTFRQEVRGLLADCLGLYHQHDQAALTARYATVNRRKQEIEEKLARAEKEIVPYAKVKSQERFYELGNATIKSVQLVVNDLVLLQKEARLFESVIVQIQHINALTQAPYMTTYLDTDNNAAASQVSGHIRSIAGLLKQAIEQIDSLLLQSNEFKQIAHSMKGVMLQAEKDYKDLQEMLSTEQYEAYRNKTQSLSSFYSRFDMNSFESIAMSSFAHNPEESYINDLRTHLYS